MFATCRLHGVLAEHERDRDLAVREAGRDEAEHLGLPARQGGVPVRFHGLRLCEEAGERPLELALLVEMGEVRVAVEGDEAGILQQRRELTAAADRNRPITPSVHAKASWSRVSHRSAGRAPL